MLVPDEKPRPRDGLTIENMEKPASMAHISDEDWNKAKNRATDIKHERKVANQIKTNRKHLATKEKLGLGHVSDADWVIASAKADARLANNTFFNILF